MTELDLGLLRGSRRACARLSPGIKSFAALGCGVGVIWELSDTIPPEGQLNKREFLTACKLIALRQNGAARKLPSPHRASLGAK